MQTLRRAAEIQRLSEHDKLPKLAKLHDTPSVSALPGLILEPSMIGQ